MIRIKSLESFPELVHAISEKEDGNMSFLWGEEKEVLESRKNFLQSNGISIDTGVCASLLHESSVAVIGKEQRGWGMTKRGGVVCDAMITREENIFLFLLTADCLPIIIYDQKVRAVGLIHASWKSAVFGIIENTLRALKENFQSEAQNLTCAFGPGIQKSSYWYETVKDKDLLRMGKYIEVSPEGKAQIDVSGYCRNVLISLGVPENNIDDCGIDTAISQNFFSHYKSLKTQQPEGRFATVVGLR